MNLFNSMLFTFATVLLSIVGLLLFRKKLAQEDLKDQHEVTDPYSQFVGMLFAVLLGFMVADAMQRFSMARQTVQQEASAVANVFRTADGLPNESKDKVRIECQRYVEVVVSDEWPKMKEHKTSSKAWDSYRDLWKQCSEYEPVTPRQQNAQSAMLSAMCTVGDCRRIRADVLHNGMPPVLWTILIVGGVATILFTFFFTTRNIYMQMAMVSIVSLVICLNVFLLASYDDPFSGDLMISSQIFETQLKLFNAELKDELTPAIEK